MEPTISSDKILELEFNYIKDTANQAIDDRYKLLNFYIAVATFVATLAVGGASLGNVTQFVNFQAALIGLSLLISMIGWLFLGMFIRLRQAWHESVTAMNQIKLYYKEQLPQQNLDRAFLWGNATIPHRHRFWNIHFYSAFLVIVIDTAFLGVALFIAGINPIATLILSLLSIAVQIFIYRISLYRNL